MEFADLPGVLLAYRRHGGEGALPVIFLHAGVCDSRMFTPQLTAFKGVDAIAYDRRGFGRSMPTPQAVYSQTDDLAGLMDALGIEAAVLVGCSQGGRIAIDFALAHPGRVRALCLIAGAISGALEPEDYPQAMRPLVAAYEAADAAGDAEALNRIEAHVWLDGPMQLEGRVGEPLRSLFLDMNAIALRAPEPGGEGEPPDAMGRLGEITCPVLAIAGEFDLPHVTARMEQAARLMPGAEYHLIDGAAHLPSLEAPETVNGLIAALIARIQGN